MARLLLSLALLLLALPLVKGQDPAAVDAHALVQKIQGELGSPVPSDESKVDPTVPHGELLHGNITDPPNYPGTYNQFEVYVPAQYDPAKPACLLVRLDGLGTYEATVLDNLIAKKEVPIMIGVGVTPGTVYRPPVGDQKAMPARFNRSYEFDSLNDHFPDYVLNVVLPAVEKLKTRDGRAINISTSGNDHAATGSSTGGIGSFTLAWRRPDQFTRVYDIIGTFVSMRGGHEYPALIRKTEPKPIRIFLEDGSVDAWNPLFGSWYDANVNMESALSFAGYDVAHAWGTHGHDSKPGMAIFPDVLRWLWRDYPAPVKVGVSQNSTLRDILPNNAGWQKIDQEFQDASGLAANAKGEVYLSDAAAATIYHLGADDKPVTFLDHAPAFSGQAFGPDGTLYGASPGEKKIIAIDPQGTSRTVADGIAGRGILVTHDGTIYVSEPGEHTDMPSQIWQITSGGEKKVIDQGLLSASGLAFSPDGGLLYAAEKSTKWIYSFVVQADGTFVDKQPFYWLHMTDIPNDSGAEDIAVDIHGELYVATRMGVQVCDHNGRVRAILPLPTPCGPVRSLCFGGEKFDTLYVTDGRQVFKRPLKIPGLAPWAAPIPYPSEGPG
jgi:sugar lactone lactonase YvrE